MWEISCPCPKSSYPGARRGFFLSVSGLFGGQILDAPKAPLDSAATPLHGILSAEKIPLISGVAEFASDSRGINHLEGGFQRAKGLNRRFLRFFPHRTGESK